MDDAIDSATEETVHALEVRLRRLEFVLAGSCKDPQSELFAIRNAGRENSVKARLNHLEKELTRLSVKSRTVKDILELHHNFPEIFKNVQPSSPTSSLTPSEKLSTIMTAAPSFHATSSQLTSIMDSPIPNPTLSTDLISLQPRINRIEAQQEAHTRQIAELRKQTTAVLERWYLVGIEGVNECFAEWDERTLEVDKILSRRIRAVESEL